MDLHDAQQLAESLMAEHLPQYCDKPWTFRFDNAKQRFGQCRYATKVISLSRHLVELNSEPQVLDTILHEIAHALAGFAAGHGPAWKAQCRKLGCKAERCYSSADVVQPTAKYALVCPTCGNSVERHRKTQTPYACGRCHSKGVRSPMEWVRFA